MDNATKGNPASQWRFFSGTEACKDLLNYLTEKRDRADQEAKRLATGDEYNPSRVVSSIQLSVAYDDILGYINSYIEQ